MMKIKITTLLVITTIILTGCSNNNKVNINEIIENTKNAKNYTINVNIENDEYSQIIIMKNNEAKVKKIYSPYNSLEINMENYIIESDGQEVLYENKEDIWVKSEVYDDNEAYKLDELINNVKSVKKIKSDIKGLKKYEILVEIEPKNKEINDDTNTLLLENGEELIIENEPEEKIIKQEKIFVYTDKEYIKRIVRPLGETQGNKNMILEYTNYNNTKVELKETIEQNSKTFEEYIDME